MAQTYATVSSVTRDTQPRAEGKRPQSRTVVRNCCERPIVGVDVQVPDFPSARRRLLAYHRLVDDRDLTHLRRAIAVSRDARAHGNHPFGAVLVDEDGAVVAEAENTVLTENDPTGHAETNLVRLAGARLAPDALVSATLYSSCEPCAMCAGAIFWAGIGRVVFALSNDALIEMLDPATDGAALGLTTAAVISSGNRSIVVEGPVLEDEAAGPHAGFWA